MEKEEFRRLRQQLGLTQEQLARLLGVSHNTVQKWEGGQNPVTGPAALAMQLMVEKQSWEQKAA